MLPTVQGPWIGLLFRVWSLLLLSAYVELVGDSVEVLELDRTAQALGAR